MDGNDRVDAAIERDKKRREKTARLKSEQDRFVKAACETFATDAGKRTLFWLMQECGYQECSVVVDRESGEVKKESTVFNEAKRDVYLRLRSLISSRPDILKEVEINHIKGE